MKVASWHLVPLAGAKIGQRIRFAYKISTEEAVGFELLGHWARRDQSHDLLGAVARRRWIDYCAL